MTVPRLPFSGSNLELDRCPHCNVDRPSINQVGSQPQTKNHLGQGQRVWKTFSCGRCGGVILVAARDSNQPIVEMYPPGAEELDDSVPHKPREYFRQAQRSLNAPAGAVMLAASAVDAMLKEKGYKEGSLYSRIKKAAEDHLITEGMAKWAHQVRLDANDQRHADEETSIPTEAEARRSVAFAKALGQFLFVLPAMVDEGIAESKS